MLANMRDLENQMKGREEGREERDKEMITEKLRKGRLPEEIADFCGCPMSLVNKVMMDDRLTVEGA